MPKFSLKNLLFGKKVVVDNKNSNSQRFYKKENHYVPSLFKRIILISKIIRKFNRLLNDPNKLIVLDKYSLFLNQSFSKSVEKLLFKGIEMLPSNLESLDFPHTSDPVVDVKPLDGSCVEIKLDDGTVFRDWTSTPKYQALWWLSDKRSTVYKPETYFVGSSVNRSYLNAVGRFPGDKYIPKGNCTIVEAGAYVGYKALGYSKFAGPESKIIAIEASSENFDLLKWNCSNNKLGKTISPHHCAIWNKDCKKSLKSKHRMQHTIAEVDELNFDEKGSVDCRSLDSLFLEYSLTQIDYLNLQLNGAEIEAIKGLNSYFRRTKIINIITRYKVKGVLIVDEAKELLIKKGCYILEDWRSDNLYNLTVRVN